MVSELKKRLSKPLLFVLLIGMTLASVSVFPSATAASTSNDSGGSAFYFGASLFTEMALMPDNSADIVVLRAGSLSGTASVDYHLEFDELETVPGIDIDMKGTLVYADGESSKTITFPLNREDYPPPAYEQIFHERFHVVLSNPVGGDIVQDKVTVAYMPNTDYIPWKPLMIMARESSGVEGGTIKVQFERNIPYNFPVKDSYFSYRTVSGTAKEGEDYTPVEGTVHFAPGEVTNFIEIPLPDDAAPDRQSEQFKLELYDFVNLELYNTEPTMTMTIYDNDAPLGNGVFEFDPVNASYGSEGSAAEVTIKRRGNLDSAASVEICTCTVPDGLATTDDFKKLHKTIKFKPGESTIVFKIPIVLDAETEGYESFKVKLLNPAHGGVLGLTTEKRVIILPN